MTFFVPRLICTETPIRLKLYKYGITLSDFANSPRNLWPRSMMVDIVTVLTGFGSLKHTNRFF